MVVCVNSFEPVTNYNETGLCIRSVIFKVGDMLLY